MSNNPPSSISRQVLFTFGALCAILLTIGALLFLGLRAIAHSNGVEQARALNKLALIDDTAQDIGQLQTAVLRAIFASDPTDLSNLEKSARDFEQINATELNDYKKFADTEKEKRLYDKVMEARKVYWERTEPLLALARGNREAEAIKAINSTQGAAYDALLKDLNDVIDYVEADAVDTSNATARFISTLRIIGDILLGVMIVILIGTGLTVAKVAHRLKQDNVIFQAEIKERKIAESSLREKTAFHEAQVNSSIDGILVVDENGNMVLQNPRFLELFKMPPEIAGAHGDEVRLKWVTGKLKDPGPFLEKVRHLYEHREEISRDEIELLDGTILDRGSSPVVGQDGKYYGRIWTFRDITARKRFDARMIKSQRLETVGKLAGGIAHEFNSILTAIIGQSELLLLDLPGNSPLGKNVAEIREAADRAAILTRQLLAYGRKQILQPKSIDLNQILAGMEGTLRQVMGRNVDIRLLPGAGLKPIRIDPNQIEQVIVNIAMNAAAVMPNGGKLTLETANASLDPDYVHNFPGLKAGDYVLLAITDTGTGITPEVKKHLFEPFFTTKPIGQGTGLGLATCYGILKQSGGHINAYSELSRGATFKIYFPSVEEQEPKPRRLEMSDLPRGTETILLVEDDPALREMSEMLLKRLGYTILTAANGVDALNVKHRQTSNHVDLVFTDVIMPHMSGKELSDRFRVLYPQTKILFTSAYTENAIVHQGVLDPGVTLLQKPFTPSALARKVREMLDG